MAKFYVESGRVRLVFEAASAPDAAVKAFQWTCDKQAEIDADTPLEHLRTAERHGWQLDDLICVDERGFGRADADCYATAEIVDAWLACPLPLV